MLVIGRFRAKSTLLTRRPRPSRGVFPDPGGGAREADLDRVFVHFLQWDDPSWLPLLEPTMADKATREAYN